MMEASLHTTYFQGGQKKDPRQNLDLIEERREQSNILQEAYKSIVEG